MTEGDATQGAAANTAASIARFQDGRFGAFFHYGLYSTLGRSEWAMYNEGAPLAEYRRLSERLRLEASPAEWVDLALRSGARYCVLTTRHHEGFCLWDTATTDYCAPRSSIGRDLVREYVDAARSAGLMVGLYYSLLDWSEPAYWAGPRRDPESWRRFTEKVELQVRELMTNYGAIDILWYDGFWPHDNPPRADDISAADWGSKKINAMARSLQPGILINDRSGLAEDFGTPEQVIIEQGRPWEACMTTNDNWGYHSGDANWKTPRQLIGALVHSVSRGGNFILNAGPRGDGSLPDQARAGFEAVGSWLGANGSSIYGCGKAPHLAREALDGGFFCNSGVWTAGAGRLYYHVLRWTGRELFARAQGVRILSARSLADGKSFRSSRSPGRLEISGLPDEPIDPYDTVLECEYEPAPGSGRFEP
jgi:Alpha-L-fucosidase